MDLDLLCVLLDLDTRNCTPRERGFIILNKVSAICRNMVLGGRTVPHSLVDVMDECLDMIHGKLL